jgi:glycosyltransferase involved in cell wall biosynthesis
MLQPESDDFVIGIRAYGRHPNLFFFNPVTLWKVLRGTSFDVLDIHEEPVSIAAAETQLVARLAGRSVPFCLYSAQNIEKRYPPPFRWLEQISLRRAAAVHTCNEAAGQILRRKGFRGPVCNLGLGVDTSRFAPANQACADGPLRVGYIGRLEPHKGVAVLIDAVARVPGCTLQIIGEGPERSSLQCRAASASVGDRVRFIGYAKHDQLVNAYRHVDVVAIPSLETPGWIEQFGRVAVEAMASGVPVVGSDSGSLPEVIGDAGVLVPPGDSDALAAALARLAADPCERRRLGRLGRQRAESFSWHEIARSQLDLYRKMVARAT